MAVKLEAFDFTEYGLIEGKVRYLSRDAIDRDGNNDRGAEAGGADPARAELVYAARIRLDCGSQAARSRLCERLRPGMAAQVEIKTDRRRIIQYLLSPIRRTVGEAGRER